MKVSKIFTNALTGALAGAVIAIFVSSSEKPEKIKKNTKKADEMKKGIEDHWISSNEAISEITK